MDHSITIIMIAHISAVQSDSLIKIKDHSRTKTGIAHPLLPLFINMWHLECKSRAGAADNTTTVTAMVSAH